MTAEDAFGLNQSRTFVMPTPGGRRDKPQVNHAGSSRWRDTDEVVCGSNSLVAVANPILNMIYQVRTLVHNPDPAELKSVLVEDIKRFEARAKQENISQEHIVAARYCLCTVLDETAAKTPWGGGGVWSRYSLLVTFHNETWGGEKFFQILSKVSQSPAVHIDLIELMFYCISLGFQGRYKIVDNGKSELELLRQRLAEVIAGVRGDHVRAFSSNWQGVTKDQTPVWAALPVWVSAVVCLILAAALYSVFTLRLSSLSDVTFANILSARLPELTSDAPTINTSVRLTQFMQPEIKAKLVRVNETTEAATVTLIGDGLFRSGSVDVSPQYEAIIGKVAQYVDDFGRSVVVSGHTDNQPIRTVRFPSNWHLSNDRARSVAGLLRSQMRAASVQITTQGLGASAPVATNSTAEGRAMNRRVDIKILTPSASY